jgi:hypothetical protein
MVGSKVGRAFEPDAHAVVAAMPLRGHGPVLKSSSQMRIRFERMSALPPKADMCGATWDVANSGHCPQKKKDRLAAVSPSKG